MINEFSILGPEVCDEFGFVIKIESDEEKNILSQRIKEDDKKHSILIDGSFSLNNYGNNDYIFTADIINDIVSLHKKIYFDPYKNMWVRDNKEIPYIHLKFVENAHISLDDFKNPVLDKNGNPIPDDLSINAGIKQADENGNHVLEFDYYWLKRYISFLQNVFDANAELVLSIPKEQVLVKEDFIDKNDLLLIAYQLKTSGASKPASDLFDFAGTIKDSDKILQPVLCYIKENSGENNYYWAFPDSKRNVYYIPMKKSIFKTSGFAEYFEKRNEIITEIFVNSLKMIMAHEIAHVARGHWNLRVNEPEYSKQRNVMLNCELNADWTASYWLINELLYDTMNNDPYYPVLAYKESDLVFLWAIRIFSCYLSLSWAYRDNRNLDKKRILAYLNNEKADHPIFEFRLYNLLGKLKEHLDHIGRISAKSEHHLLTADNIIIDNNLTIKAWEKAISFIESFESTFSVTWHEEMDDLFNNMDKPFSVKQISQEEKEKMPFVITRIEKVVKEMEHYEDQWKEIFPKLRRYGMYFSS